jgi:hypothetical protein
LLEKQNQQIEELRSILKERGSNGNSSGVLQDRERGACLLPPAPGPCTTLSLQRQGNRPQKYHAKQKIYNFSTFLSYGISKPF